MHVLFEMFLLTKCIDTIYIYEGIRIKKVAHSSHYFSFVLNGEIQRKMPHHILGIRRYPNRSASFSFWVFSFQNMANVKLFVPGRRTQRRGDSIFDFRIFDKLEIILDIASSQPTNWSIRNALDPDLDMSHGVICFNNPIHLVCGIL